MEKKINIAIDGPAGAGKSTVAKCIASALKFIYVDTGALYRSIALYAIKNDAETTEKTIKCLENIDISLGFENGVQQVFLNGENVSDEIRTNRVSMGASRVSAIPEVRQFLFELQKKQARENNVIMDGRDIGTVILPNADLKIFLTATPEARADRRYAELKNKPECPSYEKILEDIIKRDYDDSHRETAPLKKADDAVEVDTTNMTQEEVINHITDMIKEIVNKRK